MRKVSVNLCLSDPSLSFGKSLDPIHTLHGLSVEEWKRALCVCIGTVYRFSLRPKGIEFETASDFCSGGTFDKLFAKYYSTSSSRSMYYRYL